MANIGSNKKNSLSKKSGPDKNKPAGKKTMPPKKLIAPKMVSSGEKQACELGCGKYFDNDRSRKIHQVRWCKYKNQDKLANNIDLNTSSSNTDRHSLSTEIVEEATRSKEVLQVSRSLKQPCRFCEEEISTKDAQAHEASKCPVLNRILENKNRKNDAKFMSKENKKVALEKTSSAKNSESLGSSQLHYPYGQLPVKCGYCDKEFKNLKSHQNHCKQKQEQENKSRKRKANSEKSTQAKKIHLKQYGSKK
jgi:hypothetical protein